MKNYTQFQLAELVGLNEKQISRIEAGQNYPTYITFAKLIEALEIKLEDITSQDKENPKQNIENILKNSSELEYSMYFDILKSVKSNLNLIKKAF
ncbi:MAG: helix-turn-helix transcriptional regulator [Candidatus Gastranaerophilales bacterium]|nr:helix-turn-helix transcriptional regulator [Candidatus Gastranaerophilales bacterium]